MYFRRQKIMKKQDLLFILVLISLFLPFILWSDAYDFLFDPSKGLNSRYPLFVAFAKFAVLATMGELLGIRIQTGKYFKKGFGVVPHAVVWGLLGISIKIAFDIFAYGTIGFSNTVLGINNAQAVLAGPFTWNKLLIAFLISFFLNTMFAPVFMTVHKITDIHIATMGGSLKSLITPIPVREIITSMNWDVQWNFVFKKTIPLFWIPAQTVNFLFPEQFRVLNAAILGIVLGVILAIANLKK